MSVQTLLYTFISSFVALFPVMNPIGNGFIVNGFINGLDDATRKAAIKKIFLNCLMIGLGSLIAGHLILLLFGLAVPVIQVGGGILICKTGLDWLNNNTPQPKVPSEQAKTIDLAVVENNLFYPLSFPICLGPGSISVIFTLMATATVSGDLLHTGINYALIALAITTMLGVLYLFLAQGTRFTKKLSTSGNIIINKMIAFITFCIGIQIIVTGISKIFHLTTAL